MRLHAGEASNAFEKQLKSAPEDAGTQASLAVALAYAGRKDEAVREGQRAVALRPVSRDAIDGPYYLHQLARIYILVGESEKALDQLEPLLKMPYYLSPGWLKIDPNFDPLRDEPAVSEAGRREGVGSATIPRSPVSLSPRRGREGEREEFPLASWRTGRGRRPRPASRPPKADPQQ